MKITKYNIVPEIADCTKYLVWRERKNKNYKYDQQDLRTVINCLHSQLVKNNGHLVKMNEKLVEIESKVI